MTKEIALTRGLVALVDDEDYERVSKYKWRCGGDLHLPYAMRGSTETAVVHMSRFILGLTEDDPRCADHINHNTLDNRRVNLRAVTWAQNQHNRSKSLDRSSIYKGVSFRKDTGRWRAYVKSNKKRTYLGTFGTESEAAVAYNVAASKLFGKFAKLNEVA
jgi:hypothetical protein